MYESECKPKTSQEESKQCIVISGTTFYFKIVTINCIV